MGLGPAREKLEERKKKLKLELKEAWASLRAREIGALAELSGAKELPGGELEVEFIGTRVRVNRQAGKILAGHGARLSTRCKLLILRYLAGRREHEREGRPVEFLDIVGVSQSELARAFRKRVLARLLAAFEQDPERLRAQCAGLGGQPGQSGDFSVRIRIFPRMSTVIALWHGDSELDARGTFSFDSSVTAYLSLEDVLTAFEELVRRLTRKFGSEES